MVLFIIGLGLGDEKDITLRGLEAIKSCERLYLEMYTSILGVRRERLEELYGKPVLEADRETVEEGFDAILDELAETKDTRAFALLVIGDPLCATTHSDLFLRAIKKGIRVEIIHNASIINAVGITGLQVYRFGEVVTIPFFTEKWRPYSFLDKIAANRKANLHTLVLLDIKVKERTDENLLKGRKIYEPPRFMDVRTAVIQLLEAEENKGSQAYGKDTKAFGLARIGQTDQKIVAAPMIDFVDKVDMGGPLHSFVICAPELHPIEDEMYEFHRQR
eukprot:TRINITY_DN10669_c0_g2_i2.p1 TRINITY_DN10669_c0_g2~~TRINITY_DN10669_c0_g2_i2.p1  ORF type:complete len:276 (+),score=44.91 TRINITY_DN10669_c0_g2_i2:131-958(+)